MCNRGMPHQCQESGAFEMGRSTFKAGCYREEPRAFLGNSLKESPVRLDADMDEDPKDPPFDGLTIRSGEHRITTAGYLPGNTSLGETTNDVSPEQIDALVDEVAMTLQT